MSVYTALLGWLTPGDAGVIAQRYAPLPRPKVDLLAESAERTGVAHQSARDLGPGRNVNDPGERDTACWPDPYGPDQIVFGPRASRND